MTATAIFFDPSKYKNPKDMIHQKAIEITEKNPTILQSTAFSMVVDSTEKKGKLSRIKKPIRNRKEVPKFVFL